MKYLKFSISLFFLFTITMAQAQILGRIMDRATDKISRDIEDKLVEKISDEIARAAYKPVDKAIDDMFRKEYEEQHGTEDGSEPKVNYSSFLSKMMTPVDLPASYTFDVKIIGQSKDYKGKKNDMTILMSKTQGIIGMITTDDGKESMVVFDADKDVMAVYSEKDGKKQVYGMPSVMSLGTDMAAQKQVEMTMEKTGKTKKIAGYQCNLWEIEDETTITKAYVAEDFPASYAKAFSNLFKSVAPTLKNEMMEGMCLRSETKTKKKNKKSSFDTKEVILGEIVINNGDYEKVDIAQQK